MTDVDPRWDASLWNAAQMAEKLQHLGAVILDPRKPKTGFSHLAAPNPPTPSPITPSARERQF